MTLNFINMLAGPIAGEEVLFPAVPKSSIDFEASSSQYLELSNANFGSYDHAKFALSVWVKRESTGALMPIVAKRTGGNEFQLIFESAGNITLRTFDASNGEIKTTATYNSTSVWYHILAHYDGNNATAGDRMRLWVDGTEITSFATDTNPNGAVASAGGSVRIGGFSSSYFDGLIYQPAFFSGSLPAIGSVYNAGAPMDISGLTGLHSLLSCKWGDITKDQILAANWTNNNAAVSSLTVPS